MESFSWNISQKSWGQSIWQFSLQTLSSHCPRSPTPAPTFPAQKLSELSSCSGEAVGAVVSPGEATFRYPISEGCEGDWHKEESWLSASPPGFTFCRAFRAPRGSGRSREGKLEINSHFLSFCGVWVTLTQHFSSTGQC